MRTVSPEGLEKIRNAHKACQCHHGAGGGQNKGKSWKQSDDAKLGRKGLVSNFKGKTHTLEAKVKNSLNHIGKLAKENNPNWKGGTYGTERHRAMGETKYKAWRSAVFARDNYTCQICQQYNGILHADHIKKWADFPELRYEASNGRTLCRACHYYVTFKTNMPATSLWGLAKALDRKRG